MRSRLAAVFVAAFGLAAGIHALAANPSSLDEGWKIPPRSARIRAYWWWLNGNVTRESITRDLEEMKAKGFGGALICDAGGASQDGNDDVPHGPTFFTPEWRALYKHALREADRLGLEMSLNIQSGWNLGGPMVKASDAAKKLVWSEAIVRGPVAFASPLPEPKHADPYYQDLFILAYPLNALDRLREPLSHWEEKALHKSLNFSAPDTSLLLYERLENPGEEDTRSAQVVDLTARRGSDGVLRWEVPEGRWEILRLGCTVGNHAKVSTSSQGWSGYALDVFDVDAFKRYWDAVVTPLIDDAGPLAGGALKYLHTDSWEIEAANWTPTLREEFRRRRGYDLLPYLPVVAGRIVDSRLVSNRFLNDFRKTMGDLAVDHHYVPFRTWAHNRGLEIHPESGGPHASPIDAQRCLGQDDVPMSEFWARSWRHRVSDEERFFVKQPASAAHTYGHRIVAAEGFTTIGPHWQEELWENLKPSFDRACCEGLNRLVWHAFVCSPASEGVPGQQYFAGTHLNPNVTWWSKSATFFAYLNRVQFMLQQGEPVADAAYYYGDHVPNFTQLRQSNPARVDNGYDYDVVTEEVLLTRMSVEGGRLRVKGGPCYRVLVLPDRWEISLPVLRKVKEFVDAGASVVGRPVIADTSLAGYPENDMEVRRLSERLWGDSGHFNGTRARSVLIAAGVPPDFAFETAGPAGNVLDYIHRRDGDAEIYFVASRRLVPDAMRCTFRVAGKAPEIWDPVSGTQRFATAYQEHAGCTTVPLDFPPYGSYFVVFRKPAAEHPATTSSNSETFVRRLQLDGTWQVAFDPKWGGPVTADFPRLMSWTGRPEPGIRNYSGTATYRQTFALPNGIAGKRLSLDLGEVCELAEVRLNGQTLGVVWSPPYRVDITGVVKPTGNVLEIEVVNFWPNRIIGDAALPPSQRLTRTNIRKLTKDTPLMASGLLGPVRVLERIKP
jgi:hypothetical protein